MATDIEKETLKFLGDKSLTLSFRIKISELKKLISGEVLIVEIKGVKYAIKKE
jgi:hypothetical protein